LVYQQQDFIHQLLNPSGVFDVFVFPRVSRGYSYSITS